MPSTAKKGTPQDAPVLEDRPIRRLKDRIDADCPRDTITTFAELYQYRDAFFDGRFPLLVVIGSGGLSKSHAFEEALSAKERQDYREYLEGDEPDEDDEDWSPMLPAIPDSIRAVVLSSVASPVDLFKLAQIYKDKKIIIDDIDKALTKSEFVSMLKALVIKDVSNPKPSKVSWNKQNEALIAAGYKKSFWTVSPVCVILNKLQGIDHDLAAMLTRGVVVEFAPGVEEVHRFVGEWFPKQGKVQREIHDWIGKHLHYMPVPNIRYYTHMALPWAKAGMPWQEKLLKSWATTDPNLAAFVQVWNDPKLDNVEDMARYEVFSKLRPGVSYRDYGRVKARYKKAHHILGRKRVAPSKQK